jgi:hypothetical protein
MPSGRTGDHASGETRPEFRVNRQIRHTVIRVITRRLRHAKFTSRGSDIDFSKAKFDGGDSSHLLFSGGPGEGA